MVGVCSLYFCLMLLKLDQNGKISHALLAPNLVKAQEKKRLYPTLWGLDDYIHE
jgi:hypothetical protein